MRTHLRSPARRGRAAAVAALTLSLALGVTACGTDDGDAAEPGGTTSSSPLADGETGADATEAADGTQSADGTTDGTTDGTADGTTAEPVAADGSPTDVPTAEPQITPAEMPAPPANVVRIDGVRDDLTIRTRAGFGGTSGVAVAQQTTGEARAVERLCLGDIDIADMSRALTAEEWAQCEANGLDVVQFQVAADAVVVAIRSQTDVGADCLSTDQIEAGFQAGSTVQNWGQLGGGLDDVPFAAGGPTVQFDAARYFVRYILGNTEAVNSDFRADYRFATDEDATRVFVAGFESDRRRVRILSQVGTTYDAYRASLAGLNDAIEDANLAIQQAQRQQRKGIKDERPAADRRRDDQRVANAFAKRGRLITRRNAVAAEFAPFDQRFRTADAARKRLESVVGHVGLFSHGYYATNENLLRPFEVELFDGDDEQNCIFPSPQTILSGEYPLSRQLYLTVTTRSLERPEVRGFLDYYLENAPDNATLQGLIPIANADVTRQQAWLADDAEIPEFGPVDGGDVAELPEVEEEEEMADPMPTTPSEPAPQPAR